MWWWWCRRQAGFWASLAQIRSKSASCIFWPKIISLDPFILLSNSLHQTLNSSIHYTSGLFPTSFSTLVYCFMTFVLKSRDYCLSFGLFILSLPVLMHPVHSHARHHNKATTWATAHFYLPISNSSAEMTS